MPKKQPSYLDSNGKQNSKEYLANSLIEYKISLKRCKSSSLASSSSSIDSKSAPLLSCMFSLVNSFVGKTQAFCFNYPKFDAYLV